MLSLNQLSTSIQALQDSANSNKQYNDKSLVSQLNVSQSSSRLLLRKCKQIIQQQMVQIDILTKENHSLLEQFNRNKLYQNQLTQKIANLINQTNEIKQINETLHKQMNNLTKTVTQLTQKLQQKQNLIKLSSNKNQSIQGLIQNLQQENKSYKQKCTLMQQTIELVGCENRQLNYLVRSKDQEMKEEIQKLKRFKLILEKNNSLEEIDFVGRTQLPLSQNRKNINSEEELFSENPFKTISFSRYPTTNTERNSKEHKSIYDIKTADRTHQKSVLNKSLHSITPFSTVEQQPNISRIRKNVSTQKPSQTIKQKQNYPNHQFTNITIPTNKLQAKNITHPTINPQMQSQLSSIKKEILKQYNIIGIKKQLMNQSMINNTLRDIQKKLHKMTKITSIDISESQS